MIVKLGYSQIRKYAPSDWKYAKAVDSIQLKFEFMTLVCVSSLIKYVMMTLDPSSTSIRGGGGGGGSDDAGEDIAMTWLSYLLSAEFVSQMYVSGRTILALLLLSILVGSRFVGYFSIGTCL